MVNGREWNEWRFWDPDGHLKEVADFKAGERDGHVVIYFDNDSVRHDGWIRRGRQDSLMRSYYRNGRLMESGLYKAGVKTGEWNYWYADGRPMLKEVWEDSIALVLDAWDPDGAPTVVKGDGVLRTRHWREKTTEEQRQSYKLAKAGKIKNRSKRKAAR